MNQDTKDKIEDLQNLEQSINSIIGQKQQIQAQQAEVENAIAQLEDTTQVFRIVGNIMVSSDKAKVRKELDEKKEFIDLRIKTMEKQEEKLRNKASDLQKDVLDKMK
ncbi:MAG: prefoldin subunit beta [archaeon]